MNRCILNVLKTLGIPWCLVSYVICVATASLTVSCSRHDEGKNSMGDESTLSGGKSQTQTLKFQTLYDHHSYLVYLNGEPVLGGTSPGSFRIREFPLRNGSNHVSVRLSFDAKVPPPFADVYPFSWNLGVEQDDEIPKICAYEPGSGHANSYRNWEVEVNVINRDSQESQFEKLGSNRSELIEQCCDMSRKLAWLIRRKETRSLRAIFSLSEKEIAQQFNLVNGSNWEISGIEEGAKITGICGDHFVLVLCGENGTVDVDKYFVRFYRKDTKTAITLDHFLYARREGMWILSGYKDEWLSIDGRQMGGG